MERREYDLVASLQALPASQPTRTDGMRSLTCECANTQWITVCGYTICT